MKRHSCIAFQIQLLILVFVCYSFSPFVYFFFCLAVYNKRRFASLKCDNSTDFDCIRGRQLHLNTWEMKRPFPPPSCVKEMACFRD